jgi:hypothetical protein
MPRWPTPLALTALGMKASRSGEITHLAICRLAAGPRIIAGLSEFLTLIHSRDGPSDRAQPGASTRFEAHRSTKDDAEQWIEFKVGMKVDRVPCPRFACARGQRRCGNSRLDHRWPGHEVAIFSSLRRIAIRQCGPNQITDLIDSEAGDNGRDPCKRPKSAFLRPGWRGTRNCSPRQNPRVHFPPAESEWWQAQRTFPTILQWPWAAPPRLLSRTNVRRP